MIKAVKGDITKITDMQAIMNLFWEEEALTAQSTGRPGQSF